MLRKLVRVDSKLPISDSNMGTKPMLKNEGLPPEHRAPDVYTSGIYRTPVPMERVTSFGSHFISPAHQGGLLHSIDFYVEEGTKVRAPANGTVLNIKEDSDTHGLTKEYWELGNFILLECADGEYVSLEHMQHNFATRLKVKVGDRVREGSIIALSGVTGFAEFPHVHMEVLQFVGGNMTHAELLNYKNFVTKKIRFSRDDIPFDLYEEEQKPLHSRDEAGGVHKKY